MSEGLEARLTDLMMRLNEQSSSETGRSLYTHWTDVATVEDAINEIATLKARIATVERLIFVIVGQNT